MTTARRSSVQHAAQALSLPRLSKAIPSTVVPAAQAATNAAVARLLIDAEVFEDGELPPTWDDPLRACEQALAACLRRAIGPLYCLQPAFALQLQDADGEPLGHARCSAPADAPQPAIHAVEVFWGEAQEQEWPIGRGLEALEAALPGLGALVLQVLRERCARVYPLFTPDIACEAASYVYWCGEPNEDEALDSQCGDDAEAREAMRSEMLTRADLDAAYPDWARSWLRPAADQPPRRCSLRRAARVLADPRLRQIVDHAQRLGRLRCDDGFHPTVDGEYIGFGAVLSWRPGDVTVRIYDDLLQIAHEGECCDRMGEQRVALDDPGALGAWLRAMRPRFAAIGLIDRLIHALAA
jgi:PRTRC genetic system protein F